MNFLAIYTPRNINVCNKRSRKIGLRLLSILQVTTGNSSQYSHAGN